MHTRNRHLHLRPVTKLSVFYLFLSVGLAMVSTIWAVYLNSFLHSSSLVGFLSSFFMVVEIAAFIFLIPVIERTDKVKMLVLSLLLFAASYLVFAIFSNIYLVIALGTLVAIFTSLNIMSFGLIVRDNSKDENVSKNEGLVYTLFNSAWLVGPVLAGYLASRFGFRGVFAFSFALVILSILVFRFFKVHDGRVTRNVDRHPLKLVSGFFRDKDRVLTYVLTLAIAFWWAFIYIYIPLYIVNSGKGSLVLGAFLAAVTVPLVLFEFLFGRFAGKKGFKKLFFVGFASLGIISVTCFFIHGFYLTLALLVVASVSVAMIEPTTQAYFLDIISEDDRDRYFGIYSTSVGVGTLLGSLPAAILLTFLSFKYLFFIFGIPMIILAFFALKIKDSYEFMKARKELSE